jgi:hypothetical protein
VSMSKGHLFRVFAIDPEVLHVDAFRSTYLKLLGFPQGRLLMAIPGGHGQASWETQVCSGLKPIRKNGFRDWLREKKKRGVVTELELTDGCPAGSWLDSVLWVHNNEHKLTGSIVTFQAKHSAGEPIVDFADAPLGTSIAFLETHPSARVLRKSDKLVRAIEPLLRQEMKPPVLKLIDPYVFSKILRGDLFPERLTKVLRRIVEVTPQKTVLKVYTTPARDPKTRELRFGPSKYQSTLKAFVDTFPKGCRIEVYFIDEIVQKQEVHDRFILTPHGGVQASYGTDETPVEKSSSRQGVFLLSEEDRKAYWELYEHGSQGLDWMWEPMILESGAGRTPKQRWR